VRAPGITGVKAAAYQLRSLAASPRGLDESARASATPPFEKKTLLAGAPSLRLSWSSTGTEFQATAVLWDVYPDGRRWLVSRGCIWQPNTPGQEREVDLPLFHSARLIEAGHRLEVWVSPVDQPTFLASKVPSVNTVHFSQARPSWVEFLFLAPPSSDAGSVKSSARVLGTGTLPATGGAPWEGVILLASPGVGQGALVINAASAAGGESYLAPGRPEQALG